MMLARSVLLMKGAGAIGSTGSHERRKVGDSGLQATGDAEATPSKSAITIDCVVKVEGLWLDAAGDFRTRRERPSSWR